MIDFTAYPIGTFGLLMLIALVAGMIAERMKLPKVVAYLCTGLLLGPQSLDLIPHEHVVAFDPFLQLAIALVLFDLGTQLDFASLRSVVRPSCVLSLGEQLGTFIIVAITMMVVGVKPSVALLLACLALEAAPATSVLVLQEIRAVGPLARRMRVMIALSSFSAVISFEIFLSVIQFQQRAAGVTMLSSFQRLAIDLAMAFGLGTMAGLFISYAAESLKTGRWLVLLTAVCTLLVATCQSLGIPYLLVFLISGIVVANTSDRNKPIRDELSHLTGLLCVLFFAVHGTEMNFSSIQAAGLVGAAFILSRIVGKLLGVYLAARAAHESLDVQRYLGSTLLAQAGAAIALTSIALERTPEIGWELQPIILGGVMFFEFLGPLLIRNSLLFAGELPIGERMGGPNESVPDRIRGMLDRWRIMWQPVDVEKEVTIEKLIRSETGIRDSATFKQIMKHLEHSQVNTVPVVDAEERLQGVIRYAAIRDVLYNSSIDQLVRALDLVSFGHVVLPTDSLKATDHAFTKTTDDCFPVIRSKECPALLGVIRRSDVVHAIAKRNK